MYLIFFNNCYYINFWSGDEGLDFVGKLKFGKLVSKIFP